jgi:hypothetical protein
MMHSFVSFPSLHPIPAVEQSLRRAEAWFDEVGRASTAAF